MGGAEWERVGERVGEGGWWVGREGRVGAGDAGG